MLNRRPASHPPQTELYLQNRTGQHLPGETGCCSSKAVKAEEPHVNIHNSLRNRFSFSLVAQHSQPLKVSAIAARRRGAKRNSCSFTKSREHSSFSLRTRLTRSPLHPSWCSSGPLVGSAIGIRVALLKARLPTAG